jgi:hypothetical protein
MNETAPTNRSQFPSTGLDDDAACQTSFGGGWRGAHRAAIFGKHFPATGFLHAGVMSAEFKLNFLRPGNGERFVREYLAVHY